jgi:hypothetical protein
MQFRSTIELHGATATGMPVPEAVVQALGSGKRPAVRVTIGDYTFRSRIGIMDGAYVLPFNADNRKATGKGAGDDVDVTIELDEEPRVIEVPADLAAALDAEAAAKEAFEKLSYSNKRRFVLPIEDAKTPETRQRRIAKTIDQLKQAPA